VGGRFALFPRGFRTSYDAVLPLNAGQEYLLNCFEDIVARQPEVIDLLILNGDTVEGRNRFEMATGLSEVDPNWQVRAAKQVIEPLAARARHVCATRGSTYHVGRCGYYEEQLAQAVGAKQKYGHYSAPWWKFWFHGVYLDIAHRQSFTYRYRSMPMEREMEFCIDRFARAGEPAPKHIAIIRSHTHVGFKGWWDSPGRVTISTPPMKLQDDYAQLSISPNRYRPESLGMVGLRIYDEPREDGSRVDVIPYTYPYPDEGDVDVIE
jgi:hypothetical protein